MTAQAPVPRPNPEEVRPKPYGQLSEEERAVRDRQHAQALAATQAFESQSPQFRASQGESILIHFVDDGFTFAGLVWYRGQEVEIGPDHPRWQEVLNWIMLDKYQQIERWGKQFFDHGPWPGRRSYTDGAMSFEALYAGRDEQGNLTGKYQGPGEQALAQADEAERRRQRAVPLPAFGVRGL
jgi:hypothetical protein